MNNKELVNTGHELAKAIGADTPIIEIAKMVTRLATALDVQQARANALAAENAGLKALIPENWQMHDALHQLIVARPGGVYFNKWEKLIVGVLNATPATEAFLAEVRARALDEFAIAQDEQAKKYYELSPGCSGQNECQYAAGQAWYSAECIRKSATQLRKGDAQ